MRVAPNAYRLYGGFDRPRPRSSTSAGLPDRRVNRPHPATFSSVHLHVVSNASVLHVRASSKAAPVDGPIRGSLKLFRGRSSLVCVPEPDGAHAMLAASIPPNSLANDGNDAPER